MNNPMIKKMQLGLVSLSMLALLAACGNDTQQDAPTTEPPVEETQTPEESTDQGTTDTDNEGTGTDEGAQEQTEAPADTAQGIYGVEFQVSLDQAIQTFYDTFVEGVNIDDISFDEDNGRYEYQISGWDDQNDYDLEIDADTGDIIDEQTERDNDSDNVLNLDGIISPADAMDTAVEEAGSDFVEEWSLEEDDGITVYEINIKNGDDITLNAATGNFLDR